LDSLREVAQNAECVAIGECGLDFNRNFSPPDVQLDVFEKQVKLYFYFVI
jgi:TatD DNase family protein